MYIFFYYFYFTDKYSTYDVSFICQKIFSPKIYFFVSKSTVTHDLWPRHATDTLLRIQKLLCVMDIHVNFKILQHLANITTYQRHVDDISN